MKRLIQIAIVASAGLWAQAHAAALNYFLKVDGIDGESMVKGYEKAIVIDSFSWGVTNSGSSSGGGGSSSGKPAFMPFGWTQAIDKSTPKIFMAVASGEHFAKVKMDTLRAGASMTPFFSMLFEDALFTSIQMAGGSETIRVAGDLVYQKVTMTYRPQNPDGKYGPPVVGSWDLRKGGSFTGDPDVLMGLFLAQPTGIGAIPVVPEPQTWALMASGLACIGLVARRRRTARA